MSSITYKPDSTTRETEKLETKCFIYRRYLVEPVIFPGVWSLSTHCLNFPLKIDKTKQNPKKIEIVSRLDYISLLVQSGRWKSDPL